MKPVITPYIRVKLKELDRELSDVPRCERPRALDFYKLGLEISMHKNYPQLTPEPRNTVFPVQYPFDKGIDRRIVIMGNFMDHINPSNEDLCGFYFLGDELGKQFGELEVQSARETILSEIEKRKKKFSQLSWWDFSRFWRRGK